MAARALVTVSWKIKPEATDAFVSKLKGDFERVVSRPGFRSIRLHRGSADPAQFVLVEEWDDAADFHNYVAYRNELGDAQDFYAMCSAPPEIAIYASEALSFASA